ncbi:TRAP transporter large permease [Bacillus sp. EB106-08-02-XG196]|jgi:C4-dicarboxylate transporter, DctM subunit|uniref:TRAP transporter large permease n=1 Tax=Bacillus sp. EB106-08-02-XG196 TaxID=2737049 RepID=UPI0015C4E4C0|nr:TRAP transporter large permease [Bacillus sp. EB106-08-02-XG196]NWQ43227.1 TRAP transporter large permease [Bacillus sp. EB106-08-02-XG196]
MIAIILFGVFFLLLFLRVPIAIALGAASILSLISTMGTSSLGLISDIMYTSVAKFTLLSIPFFIIAGVIMDYAGISKRLINFADTFVGHKKHGMALVTVITALFFAAISGSGPATVAAIGGILIPALVKNGYKTESAAALLSGTGATGIVIPPSIALIVFAVVAGDSISVSIGRMFIAGIIPGLLMGVGFYLAAIYVKKKDTKALMQEAKKAGIDFEIAATKEVASPKERWQAFTGAIWGILVPVIILGGIYGGVFTPTESAVVAVFYGLFVGIFIHKELKLKDIKRILIDSGVQTATVMLIVSSASLFAYVITTEGIADLISDAVLGLSENRYIILILVNIILLIAGMFMDAISAYYIFVPILLPIMIALGVDPTVFGVFMTVNLAIGLFTPPVGVNLYVACGISNISLNKISKAIVPFVVASIVVLILITYIPAISTFLPNLLGVK